MIKKLFAALLVPAIIFAMAMPAYADKDDYDDHDDDKNWQIRNGSDSMFTLGDEIYFGDMVSKEWNGKDPLADVAKQHTPNTVSNTQTISAGGATRLVIDTSRCGVAVEPSTTGSFELSYIGAKDISLISTSSAVTGNTIRFTIKGDKKLDYVNSNPASRVNVVLLKVPANISSLYINEGSGVIHVTGLTVPIKGETTNGIIKVMGSTLNSGYDLSAENGTIRLEGDTIGGKVDLSAENGSVKIFGKTVNGDIELSAENGKASITADTLGSAELECDNGKIELDVGAIIGNVKAEVDNGKITANLRKAPVNLTLNINASLASGKITLPTGWKSNSVFGTGAPRLSLSCKNGKIELTNNA